MTNPESKSPLADAEAKLFDGIAAVQEQILKVNKMAAERITAGLAELPELPEIELPDWATSAADSMPELPAMPELPTAAEWVEQYFDFTAKMLETNRQFAEQIAAVWTEPTKKSTKKPAKKAAAKKSPAKKSPAKKSPAKK